MLGDRLRFGWFCLLLYLFYVYRYGCCLRVHVYTPCIPGARRGLQIPETRVIDNCELPYECWEPNRGPLEKQPVSLATGPSLLPQYLIFLQLGTQRLTLHLVLTILHLPEFPRKLYMSQWLANGKKQKKLKD